MRTAVDLLRSLKKYVSVALGEEWEVRLAFEEGTFTRPYCRVSTSGPLAETGSSHHVDASRPFHLLCHPQEAASPDEAQLEAGRVEGLIAQAFSVGVGRALEPPAKPTATVNGTGGTLPAGTYFYRVSATAPFEAESAASPSSSAVVVTGTTSRVTLAWAAISAASGYTVFRGTAAGSETILAQATMASYEDTGAKTPGTSGPLLLGKGTLGRPRRVPLWDWQGIPIGQTSSARQYPDFAHLVDLSINQISDPDDETRVAVAADLRLRWRRRGAVPYGEQTLAELRAGYSAS